MFLFGVQISIKRGVWLECVWLISGVWRGYHISVFQWCENSYQIIYFGKVVNDLVWVLANPKMFETKVLGSQ